MLLKIACGQCGEQIEFAEQDAGTIVRCPHCNQPLQLPIPKAAPTGLPPDFSEKPAEEETFYFDHVVIVTKTRFIDANDETFPISGITSVRLAEESPSSAGPVSAFIVAGVFLLVGIPAIMGGATKLGVAACAACIFYVWLGVRAWIKLAPTYSVAIRTAEGERKTCQTGSRNYAQGIIDALNQALTARG